jgi:hypothetical protein
MKDNKEFARLVALSMQGDAKLKTAMVLAGEMPVRPKEEANTDKWMAYFEEKKAKEKAKNTFTVTLGDLIKEEVKA